MHQLNIYLYCKAFTVYFEIIESTLLVEALRNDKSHDSSAQSSSFCESCHKVSIIIPLKIKYKCLYKLKNRRLVNT